MKLVDQVTLTEYQLPDLFWSDEFKWHPVVSQNTYSLLGALIIEPAVRLSGRKITLVNPQPDMGWITRLQLIALQTAAAIVGRKFTFHLEYPNDSRTFTVVFDHQDGRALEAEPVVGFPHVKDDEYFTVTLNLIEVPT